MMYNIELSTFIIDIFGKKGPKMIDTQIAEHNFFLEEDLGEEKYQKLVEEDKMGIGREGKNINKTDLRKFLKAFEERQSLEVFNNDRTYSFEGIEIVDDNNYEITWGSIDFSERPPVILPCPVCESSPKDGLVAHYRRKGEKARAWSRHNLVITEIKHGDIIYDTDGYRGTSTDVVCNTDAKKSVTINTGDDAGYCEIPKEVSAHIEDPADFYSEVFSESLYQGVTRIILDSSRNQSLLQELAGRPVHSSREVWWDSDEYMYFIQTPPSPDCPQGTCAALNKDTPIEYLGDSTEIQNDPLVAKQREKISLSHSRIEDSVAKSLSKNGFLSIGDLPTKVDGGCFGCSFDFKEFKKDADQVVTEVGCEKYDGTSIVFTLQKCPLEHGPYAQVHLWTADNPSIGSPRKYILNLESYE